MVNDDPFVSALLGLNYCQDDQKKEYIEGINLGFRIAHASSEAGMKFSRELYGFLIRFNVQIFSLKDLTIELCMIKDIVFYREMIDWQEAIFEKKFRLEFVNALKVGYEMAMNAFLTIKDNSRDEVGAKNDVEVYNEILKTFVAGLRNKLQMKVGG